MTWQALWGGSLLVLIVLGCLWLMAFAPGWTGDAVWLLPRLGLTLVSGVIALHIVRWLWAPSPAPEGIPLSRQEVPDLYAVLTDLQERFRIHQPLNVCITGEMNASIMSRPGQLTLQIGLPLLLGVTPRQCDAILSHEFGHLVLQRAGPGRWATHMHAWWFRILDRIDQDDSFVGRFARWVLGAADRRYLADGLRLSHDEEFQADAVARRTVGSRPLAEALSSIALKEHFLTRDFMPKIHGQVFQFRRPVMLPYRHMASALQVGYDSAKTLADYADEIEDDTPTHPSIRSRLARLTAEPWPLPGHGPSAAEAYLGHVVPNVALALDQAWWKAHAHEWTRHHREVQWAQRRIGQLIKRGRDKHPLRRLELARLIEIYRPEWDPLEAYLDLLGHETVSSAAMLALGRLLLERDDVRGIGYLLALLEQDNEVGLAAAHRLADYAADTRRLELAQRAALRADILWRKAALIEHGMGVDPIGDGWFNPRLDPITRYKLAKALSRHRGIKRAYVVRRHCEQASQWSAYVLILRTDLTDDAVLKAIRDDIEPLLSEYARLALLPLPTRSPYEQAAADIPRSRLQLRRTKRNNAVPPRLTFPE